MNITFVWHNLFANYHYTQYYSIQSIITTDSSIYCVPRCRLIRTDLPAYADINYSSPIFISRSTVVLIYLCIQVHFWVDLPNLYPITF